MDTMIAKTELESWEWKEDKEQSDEYKREASQGHPEQRPVTT